MSIICQRELHVRAALPDTFFRPAEEEFLQAARAETASRTVRVETVSILPGMPSLPTIPHCLCGNSASGRASDRRKRISVFGFLIPPWQESVVEK